jgi:hypothetical protein
MASSAPFVHIGDVQQATIVRLSAIFKWLASPDKQESAATPPWVQLEILQHQYLQWRPHHFPRVLVSSTSKGANGERTTKFASLNSTNTTSGTSVQNSSHEAYDDDSSV